MGSLDCMFYIHFLLLATLMTFTRYRSNTLNKGFGSENVSVCMCMLVLTQ